MRWAPFSSPRNFRDYTDLVSYWYFSSGGRNVFVLRAYLTMRVRQCLFNMRIRQCMLNICVVSMSVVVSGPCSMWCLYDWIGIWIGVRGNSRGLPIERSALVVP